MFKEILLPTDGSTGVKKAIESAVAIARVFDARIHVLFVVEPPRYQEFGSGMALGNVMESLREAGQQGLEATVRMVRELGMEPAAQQIKQGHPAEEIVGYAKAHGIDLIVMGTHGRRGLNRVLLGSIAEEVVRSSEIPVMTVRMREETE